MTVAAGKLNRRFTVLVETIVTGTSGEEQLTYAAANPPVKFWGSLEAVEGRELYESQTDRTEQRFEITTHYRTDLSSKRRLRDEDNVTYQIETFADPEGRRHETHIRVLVLG